MNSKIEDKLFTSLNFITNCCINVCIIQGVLALCVAGVTPMIHKVFSSTPLNIYVAFIFIQRSSELFLAYFTQKLAIF
jgi:hypothetical protein